MYVCSFVLLKLYKALGKHIRTVCACSDSCSRLAVQCNARKGKLPLCILSCLGNQCERIWTLCHLQRLMIAASYPCLILFTYYLTFLSNIALLRWPHVCLPVLSCDICCACVILGTYSIHIAHKTCLACTYICYAICLIDCSYVFIVMCTSL